MNARKWCQVMVAVEVEGGRGAQERAVLSVHRALEAAPRRMSVAAQVLLRRALQREAQARQRRRLLERQVQLEGVPAVERDEAEPRCGICGTSEPCDQHPAQAGAS